MTSEDPSPPGAPTSAEPAPRTEPLRMTQRPGQARHRSTGGRRRGERRKPPTRRTKPKRSFLRELPGIVITALIISVLIKTFLVQAFYIPSGSMENTLLVNDRVLVNKLADKPDEIHRGDVVVFRDPGGWLTGTDQRDSNGLSGALRDALVFVGLAPAAGEEDLIKRVIGVGGDHVRCCDDGGRITVNGTAIAEPYLYPGDEPSAQRFEAEVPQGSLWVMGDHRSVSEDSRAHLGVGRTRGFVPIDDVIGRAFTIVWPLDRAHLLRTPDNFDQPLDGSGG